MVKKTYRTFFLKGLVIHFKKEDGTPVDVTFRSGIHVDSTARYSTSNGDIQRMLENSSGFGRDYYVEDAQEISDPSVPVPQNRESVAREKEQEKVLTDVKDIKRFHNLVEMKNYMSEIGLPVTQEMNYLQAKAAASKEGYDFQIQKQNT